MQKMQNIQNMQYMHTVQIVRTGPMFSLVVVSGSKGYSLSGYQVGITNLCCLIKGQDQSVVKGQGLNLKCVICDYF